MNTTNEFDIIVEDGIIIDLAPITVYDYPGEGNYKILAE